jgi:hypothetical protein
MQPDRAWLVPNSLPCQGPFSTIASATLLKCRQTDRQTKRKRKRERERLDDISLEASFVNSCIYDQLTARSLHGRLGKPPLDL